MRKHSITARTGLPWRFAASDSGSVDRALQWPQGHPRRDIRSRARPSGYRFISAPMVVEPRMALLTDRRVRIDEP